MSDSMDPARHAVSVHAAHAAIERGDLAAAKVNYAQAWRSADVGTLVIGDSHVFTFLQAEHVLPVWLGPITMHRVGRDGPSLLALSELGAEPGLDVVFCFGEIDARWHIDRQAARRATSVDVVVADLADRYLSAIGRMLDRPGLRCFVATPVPPQDIAPGTPHAALPAAPLAERIVATRRLSEALVARANACGFGILDLHALFRGADGAMRSEFASDGIHAYTQAGREHVAALLRAYQGGDWTRSPLANAPAH